MHIWKFYLLRSDADADSVQLSMDIGIYWTGGYAGQSPNGGHELAIYAPWL